MWPQSWKLRIFFEKRELFDEVFLPKGTWIEKRKTYVRGSLSSLVAYKKIKPVQENPGSNVGLVPKTVEVKICKIRSESSPGATVMGWSVWVVPQNDANRVHLCVLLTIVLTVAVHSVPGRGCWRYCVSSEPSAIEHRDQEYILWETIFWALKMPPRCFSLRTMSQMHKKYLFSTLSPEPWQIE